MTRRRQGAQAQRRQEQTRDAESRLFQKGLGGPPQALGPMIELLGGSRREWGAVTPPLAIAA